MQNKYFKYLFFAILVIFIVPQITLAAWYNPFSWNWNVFTWFHPVVLQPAHKSPGIDANDTININLDKNTANQAQGIVTQPVQNSPTLVNVPTIENKKVPTVVSGDVSIGFVNAKDSTRLKSAWRNKSLLLTSTDSIEQQISSQKYCWDFNNFSDAKVYRIKPDGTKLLANSGKAHLELSEYINTNSPGITPGDYVLSFISIGNTVQVAFKTVISGTENNFVDNRGGIFEIKPSGYCTNNL